MKTNKPITRITTCIGYALVNRSTRVPAHTSQRNTAKIYSTSGHASAAAKQSVIDHMQYDVLPVYIEEPLL